MPESNDLRKIYGNFQLIDQEKANGVIDVCKYKSSKTGLKVVIAQVEGPVVNGYFALATEAFDDDGLPHTLEHLIFLGSEDYPYKGILDLIANRMLANGSNAWTDTDHTCYTVTTAGSEGFLSLMPIYIDHILYPTLKDSAFVTEVHHINGEGKDAGVVYCEAEGTENTGESLVHEELVLQMYPGKCGYKSQIGGKLKNLRESTNITKIRNYHKEFYRPDNLTLIVTGQINEDEFFKALEPVEAKIISKGPLSLFERPWQSPVEPLTESKDVLVLYPNDSEDNGMVYIAWRGPSIATDYYEMLAITVLFRYLTDTSISWLMKDFVEIVDPYASSVECALQEHSVSVVYLVFKNVPVDKLDLVKDKLFSSLDRFFREPDSLNMTRMKSLIHKQKSETLINLENQPHDSIADSVIGDMLYGNSSEDFKMRLNSNKLLDKMALESGSFWKGLLNKYFLNAPSVTVRGKPSREKQEKLTEVEEERIAEQIKVLGPKGLEEKEKILNDAILQNEIPPPEGLLTKLPIPDLNKISFHEIKSYSQHNTPNSKIDFSKAPVYMYINDLKTNFVYMLIIMNTESLSVDLRPYLLLYLESLLESPIQRGDKLIDHKDVVAELEADTVLVSTNLGIRGSRFCCGPYCQTASLVLQVEPQKYEVGIKWMKELLFDTVFTPERLKIIATKIINDVSQWKRNGRKINFDIMRGMCFSEKSNFYWNSILRQQKFLTSVVEKLDMPASAEIILRELDAIRILLSAPGNMAVHMAANLENLNNLYTNFIDPWANLLPENVQPVKIKYSVVSDQVHVRKTSPEEPTAYLVSLGCVDSTFLCQTVPCMTDFNDPDLPALMLFIMYLSQLEGPLWKQIRGQGLSYSYNISVKINEGLLYLSFYRSTNVFASYKETKRIILSYLEEEVKFEDSLLDSAKSALIFDIIETESCIGGVVQESILCYFKNIERNFNKNFLSKVSKVTPAEMLKAGKKYISPLYLPNSKISIVCHPSKVNEIATNFLQLNVRLEVQKTLEDTVLNNC